VWLQWRGRHEEALLVEARLHVAKGDPDAEDAAAAAADPYTETLLPPDPDVGQPMSAAATASAIYLQTSLILRTPLQKLIRLVTEVRLWQHVPRLLQPC